MGIDIKKNRVFYNSAHHKRIDTRVSVNPITHQVNKMPVQAIFRRMTSSGAGGDGNALIYALKRISPYKISNKEIAKFLPEFYRILSKSIVKKQSLVVIPLPSSKKIPQILAKRVKRILPNAVIYNIFEKKTNGDVLADLQNINFSHIKELQEDSNQLKHALGTSPNKIFQMKLVTNKMLRTYIQPLKLIGNPAPFMNEVLFVDDLLSTGSTFTNAKDLLSAGNYGTLHTGLVLLGSVSK